MSARLFVLLGALAIPVAAQTKNFSVTMRMQSLVVVDMRDGTSAPNTFDRREVYAANGNRMSIGIDPTTEGMGEIFDYQKLEVIGFDSKAKVYRRMKMEPHARSVHLKTAARTCWYYFPKGPCTDGPVLQGFRTKVVKQGADSIAYIVRDLDWFAIRRENRNRGKLLSFQAAIEVKLIESEPTFVIPEGLVEEPDPALYEKRGLEARGHEVTLEMLERIRERHASREVTLER